MISNKLRRAVPAAVALTGLLVACRGASFDEVSEGARRPVTEHGPTVERGPGGPSHGHATAEAPPGQAPRAVFAETSHDWGSVEQGARASHVFKVRNAGEGVLHVKRVRGS